MALYDHNGGGVNFNVDRISEHTFKIELKPMIISKLDRVDLAVITQKQCEAMLVPPDFDYGT